MCPILLFKLLLHKQILNQSVACGQQVYIANKREFFSMNFSSKNFSSIPKFIHLFSPLTIFEGMFLQFEENSSSKQNVKQQNLVCIADEFCRLFFFRIVFYALNICILFFSSQMLLVIRIVSFE